ncbi:hypothetical protein SAY86_010079 [Trapa natans]|uniref:Protein DETOXIFICATION n=1 Tax=Trapa natans TaxID=22666 RepID=A0AAN7QQ57_TRANT|nr:hypothetical protein SAY86_010079 [Trapa natans]
MADDSGAKKNEGNTGPTVAQEEYRDRDPPNFYQPYLPMGALTEDSIQKEALLLNETTVVWRRMRFGAVDITDRKLMKKWVDESKKTWEIAAPAILTSVAQFSLSFVTAAFVGHIGAVELAAVSIVDNVLEGFVYGIMDKHISEVAGRYSKWVIPQLFAYALNFPIQKFLQSQSKVWVMTFISIAALAFHGGLNWLLITRFNHGLFGAAMAGNISWWFMVMAQMVYVVSGYFPEAWTGLSFQAFKSLAGFVKLSLASAVMLWLVVTIEKLHHSTASFFSKEEIKAPKLTCDVLQLGALVLYSSDSHGGHPEEPRSCSGCRIDMHESARLDLNGCSRLQCCFAVSLLTSTFIGLIFTAAILATTNEFPKIFTKTGEVISATSKLGYYLAATIFLNSIQPVLHGVAVGAGWQVSVALINIGCYYIVGLPIGAVLGYKFKHGAQGIWIGMLIGCLVQTLVLLYVIFKTNWQKEASKAEERMRTWGGTTGTQETTTELSRMNGAVDGEKQ